MFITPTVVKTEAKSKVFTIHKKPVVNLKSYCHSNVQNIGEWRMDSLSVHEEMIGFDSFYFFCYNYYNKKKGERK